MEKNSSDLMYQKLSFVKFSGFFKIQYQIRLYNYLDNLNVLKGKNYKF